MASNSIPNAVWEGSFTLFGVEIKCVVLDNGQRFIEAESFAKLLNALNDGSAADAPTSDAEIEGFAKWHARR